MTETPTPYDVVLGGTEGIVRRIRLATTAQERQAAIAHVLDSPKGLEVIKTLGTQWCVSVSLTFSQKYVAVIYQAVEVEGYISPYWFARSVHPQEFETFNEAVAAATVLAQEEKYPLLFEIGHLTRAVHGWASAYEKKESPWQQAHLYPVTEQGNRITFSGKTHFKKAKLAIAGEPDRIGMTPVFSKRQQSVPMELWKTGIEETPDEKLLAEVNEKLEKAKELGLIHSFCFTQDKKRVSIEYGGINFLDDEGNNQIGFSECPCLKLKEVKYFLMGMRAAKIHLERESAPNFWDARNKYREIQEFYKPLEPEY